jgi:hypothetical protein
MKTISRFPSPSLIGKSVLQDERPAPRNDSWTLAMILWPHSFPLPDEANMFDKSKPGYLQVSSVFEELHHRTPSLNPNQQALMWRFGDTLCARPHPGLTRTTFKIHILDNRSTFATRVCAAPITLVSA